MVKQYKKIMNDELGGYHKQMNKMKNNDTSAILRARKKGRVF
jgi:hypothetical protein